MEQEPPRRPPEDEDDADVIPFTRPESPLDASMRRHPSHGRETPEETLRRLGLDDDPDDPDSA